MGALVIHSLRSDVIDKVKDWEKDLDEYKPLYYLTLNNLERDCTSVKGASYIERNIRRAIDKNIVKHVFWIVTCEYPDFELFSRRIKSIISTIKL